MSIIEISHLAKIYSKSQNLALDDFNIKVKKGEIVGLLGPNGAGKTTVLNILATLLRPTYGSVKVMGTDANVHPQRIRSLIGFVPQNIALYPTLTARENFIFFAHMQGIARKDITGRVNECLAVVGLSKSADRRIETFSGGMKRRANFGVVLMHKPPLLLLDEPTVGIDAQSRSLIFENLRLRSNEGVTILYATHIINEVSHMCSRIIIMDKGRVLKDGSPAELVLDQPECSNLDDLFFFLTGRNLRD